MTVTELEKPQEQTTKRWSGDRTGMSVEFAVKTFWGLKTVRGSFGRFTGSYEAGLDRPKVELAIDADSLDTGNRMRDEHLRSAAFFNAAQYPQVRFTSTGVEEDGDGAMHITGRLEAAGRTIPVGLDATFRELGPEFEIEATTTIDQRRLGMSSGPLAMIRPPARIRVTGTARAR